MSSLTDRLRRSLAMRGWIGTARMCCAAAAEHLVPAHRKMQSRRREADARYDEEFGVDTGGIVRPTEGSVVGNNWSMGISYQAVDPDLCRNAIQSTGIDFTNFTFLDFGSGKGRALMIASELPFKRIIGVEYCEELNKIAWDNICRHQAARRHGNVEVVGADAAEFPIPPDPLVLFFYNPFAEPVMRTVAHNVSLSYQAQPRRILLIYFTPYFTRVWEELGIFTRVNPEASDPALLDSGAPQLSGRGEDTSSVLRQF